MSIEEVRVLICDDSVFARKKLKDFLISVGIKEVFEATDGIEAIKAYKDNSPTVVFMDIIMPKKSGIEDLQEIIDFDKKAKVVMASSVGTQNHLKDSINAGACEFLQKPIENDYVLKIINNIIKEAFTLVFYCLLSFCNLFICVDI
ncbi:MAG TPA: response regulator [Clostridiales bacterium]|nr:response regulator [Clostridiales bacterium]